MSFVHNGISSVGKLAVEGMANIGTREKEKIEITLLNAALNKKIYGAIITIVALATTILLLPLLLKGTALGTLLSIGILTVDLSLFVVGFDLFKMGMNIAQFAASEKKKASCFIKNNEGYYQRSKVKEQESRCENRRWNYYTKGTLFLQHIVHYYLTKTMPHSPSPQPNVNVPPSEQDNIPPRTDTPMATILEKCPKLDKSTG